MVTRCSECGKIINKGEPEYVEPAFANQLNYRSHKACEDAVYKRAKVFVLDSRGTELAAALTAAVGKSRPIVEREPAPILPLTLPYTNPAKKEMSVQLKNTSVFLSNRKPDSWQKQLVSFIKTRTSRPLPVLQRQVYA